MSVNVPCSLLIIMNMATDTPLLFVFNKTLMTNMCLFNFQIRANRSILNSNIEPINTRSLIFFYILTFEISNEQYMNNIGLPNLKFQIPFLFFLPRPSDVQLCPLFCVMFRLRLNDK